MQLRASSPKPSLKARGYMSLVATGALAIGCSRDPNTEAPTADWADVIKLSSLTQFDKPDEVIAKVKAGEFSRNVLETSSPRGETFTYVFVRNVDDRPALLRGVLAGPDRAEFLEKLRL